jgi:hypothetical protein
VCVADSLSLSVPLPVSQSLCRSESLAPSARLFHPRRLSVSVSPSSLTLSLSFFEALSHSLFSVSVSVGLSHARSFSGAVPAVWSPARRLLCSALETQRDAWNRRVKTTERSRPPQAREASSGKAGPAGAACVTGKGRFREVGPWFTAAAAVRAGREAVAGLSARAGGGGRLGLRGPARLRGEPASRPSSQQRTAAARRDLCSVGPDAAMHLLRPWEEIPGRGGDVTGGARGSPRGAVGSGLECEQDDGCLLFSFRLLTRRFLRGRKKPTGKDKSLIPAPHRRRTRVSPRSSFAFQFHR